MRTPVATIKKDFTFQCYGPYTYPKGMKLFHGTRCEEGLFIEDWPLKGLSDIIPHEFVTIHASTKTSE